MNDGREELRRPYAEGTYTPRGIYEDFFKLLDALDEMESEHTTQLTLAREGRDNWRERAERAEAQDQWALAQEMTEVALKRAEFLLAENASQLLSAAATELSKAGIAATWIHEGIKMLRERAERAEAERDEARTCAESVREPMRLALDLDTVFPWEADDE